MDTSVAFIILFHVSEMSDTVENLILDLIEWIERKERTYSETMDAWRTSCPRLTVWEDATDRGAVETTSVNGVRLVRDARRFGPPQGNEAA